jgi:hypothetical protein
MLDIDPKAVLLSEALRGRVRLTGGSIKVLKSYIEE